MTSPTGLPSLLIRNADAIVTGRRGAAARTQATDIRIRDGLISEVGRLSPHADERIIHADDCVIYPGWVNTHHHLFQALLKGVRAGVNASLAEWLAKVASPYRQNFNEQILRTAARVGIAELMLSGCTTIADHHYLYYPDMGFNPAEVLFDVAAEMGVRFVLCRGGMTLPAPGFEQSTPAFLKPESLDAYIGDVERQVSSYHDASPIAMRRVVMAPTTPTYRVRVDELPEFARAARRLGIKLHSHLSENLDYVRYCREQYDMTPIEFCEQHEWLGPDVWFAHLVHVNGDEIARMARHGTGVAHCPASNGRLGSGIAPVPQMMAAGMPVSLAVDGAASNEAADMISEAHTAWLIHRAAMGASGAFDGGAQAVTVEDVVHWGTEGGAQVLGLHTGVIAPGYAADIAVYSLDEPRYFGLHDRAIGPVASGGRPRLRALLVGGHVVVENDSILGLDLESLGAEARQAVRALEL